MKETIPNIKCHCGRTIRAWGYVKKGITLVYCQCGASWRLVKAGKPIIVGGEGITFITPTHKGGME